MHFTEGSDLTVPKKSIALLFLLTIIIFQKNEAYSSIMPTVNPMPDKLFVPAAFLKIKIPDKLPSFNHDVEMPKLANFKQLNNLTANKTLNKSPNLNLPISYESLKYQPFIWPVIGKVSSSYGFRVNGTQGGIHHGVDIPAPRGTPIMAARSGVVTRADSVLRGYGKLVIIDHGNGVETRYAHCSDFAVSKGDFVNAGQVIAYVGSSGRSTSNHVHFEVLVNGLAYNPMRFLGEYNSALISHLTKKYESFH